MGSYQLRMFYVDEAQRSKMLASIAAKRKSTSGQVLIDVFAASDYIFWKAARLPPTTHAHARAHARARTTLPQCRGAAPPARARSMLRLETCFASSAALHSQEEYHQNYFAKSGMGCQNKAKARGGSGAGVDALLQSLEAMSRRHATID